MNLTSKKVIKSLLRSEKIRPSKRLGQNFLISSLVLDKIVKASELEQEDIVLEIGPGIGTLTCQLAKKVKRIIAVEKDGKLISILEQVLEKEEIKNVEIIQEDILKLEIQNPNVKCQIPDCKAIEDPRQSRDKSKIQIPKLYKIISNLPYNIATKVIRKFLEIEIPPKLMLLMIQKEVGQRICSFPPKMQRLAVLIQAVAEVKILEIVKKKYFWPQPKVDSVILKIVPKVHSLKLHDRELWQNQKLFQKIVKAGFSQPRKQLINNFSKSLGFSREKIKSWLQQNNISPIQRAESLSLNDWFNLVKTFIPR